MAGKRTLVFGKGINDSDTPVRCRKTKYKCPYYSRWAHMIKRCYSEKFHEKSPTYRDCEVCDEWLVFSNFKKWMQQQSWEGMHLDKDIISPGNKIYSPETCAFVTQNENSMLCDSGAIRGELPKGVCFHKQNKNYIAYITINNKRVTLGSHKTAELAKSAYDKAKKKVLLDASRNASSERVARGFLLHYELY